MSFFREIKTIPTKINYPGIVKSEDIKTNGLLLSDDEIKKTIEILSTQPDKRFSKQELKDLGFNYQYGIIKNENKYFVIYKKHVYIGEGGQGKVKLAQFIGNDLNSILPDVKQDNWPIGKLFAMKVSRSDAESRSNFANDIDILKLLGRAYTKVIERIKGNLKKQQYLQEYYPGSDLTLCAFFFNETINIMFNALAEMRLLHSRGILHGDIKLDNIIVQHENQIVHFIDFGIAHKMDEKQQYTSKPYRYILFLPIYGFSGTPEYMAPEITGASYVPLTMNEKTEIYALGKVFKQLLDENYLARIDSSKPSFSLLREKTDQMLNKESAKRPTADELYHFFENLPSFHPKSLMTKQDKNMIVDFLNHLYPENRNWSVGDIDIYYSVKEINDKVRHTIANDISSNCRKAGLSEELITFLQEDIELNKSKNMIHLCNPTLLSQLRDAAKKYQEEVSKEWVYLIRKR